MLRFETYKNDIEYPKQVHKFIDMKHYDWNDEYADHYNEKIMYALEMENPLHYTHNCWPYKTVMAGKTCEEDINHFQNIFLIKKVELALYQIKKLIKENNLSYEQVEEYLGKEDGYINKILKRDMNLELCVLYHLTYLFNCSLGYISGRSWCESIVSYDLSTYSSQDLRKFANRNRIYVANKRNIKKILNDKLWK